MKRAVSVSLGSSARDKRVEVEMLGERILLERIGTDGDVDAARTLYRELDREVDAFGVGGIDLSIGSAKRRYPLRAAHRLIADVTQTPVVDGNGLKHTLERRCMQYVEMQIGEELQPKRAMITSAMDRYGMAESLVEACYDLVMGDLFFALGLPIPVRTMAAMDRIASVLAPLVGRFAPIHLIYPTGEAQETTVPGFTRWYNWATVVAGDCSYVKRHMPPQLPGKTILTNTTTEQDVARFRDAGVRYLVTTTPRFNGRTFGTNMMEAGLVAVAGKGRPLTCDELDAMLSAADMHPQIQRLN